MSARMSEKLAAAVRAHRGLFVAAVVTVTVAMWVTVGAMLWFVRDTVTDLPDRETLLGVGSMAQATTLLDVNGRQAFTIFKEQRIEVPLSRVSPHLVRAILAIEDQRFYDHGGVDVVRVAGAAWTNVLERRAAQGGSTLTQQLARQSFLTPDKTIQRKLKEIVVAARLESEFTKDEILELYLNKVYFGDGLYGVEAASLGLLRQACGRPRRWPRRRCLPVSSSRRPRTRRPSAPSVRWRVAMSCCTPCAQSGVIDRAGLRGGRQGAGAAERHAAPRRSVRAVLQGRSPQAARASSSGGSASTRAGCKVYTTIDLDMQKAAEAEVARALNDIEQRQAKRRGKRPPVTTDPLQAALVALDPVTGEVRAMVGGREFRREQVQPRHAGEAAAGLGVQAVRLRRGARARLHAGDAHHRPQRARDDAAG